MRLLCFFCVLLFGNLTWAQTETEVNYDPNTPLTWEDFKSRVGPDMPGFKAYTWTGIRMEVTTDETGVHLKAEAYFVQGKSWVVKGAERADLLRHEQLHFDITELHTRRLRAALAPYQGLSAEEFVNSGVEERVQDIYNRIFDQMNAEQKRYDKETNHSINTTIQKAWSEHVRGRLEVSAGL